jgi:hypothetical protein
VINDFVFPEAARLLRYALPAARRIAALKMRFLAKGVPVIYVNDNFGRWRSDFAKQVEHCLESDAGGRAITQLLQAGAEDYFVLDVIVFNEMMFYLTKPRETFLRYAEHLRPGGLLIISMYRADNIWRMWSLLEGVAPICDAVTVINNAKGLTWDIKVYTKPKANKL